MIAIECCRRLQTTTNTKVAGLVLIDTPNTQRWKSLGPELVRYEPDVLSASAWVRKAVKQRFARADDLVNGWGFPSATDLLERPGPGPECPTMTSPIRNSYRAFPVSKHGNSDDAAASHAGLASLRFDADFHQDLRRQQQKGVVQPTMLMRAVDMVSSPSASEVGRRVRVDADREWPLLGWEHHPVDYIRVVQDIHGDHYTIFDGDEKVCLRTTAVLVFANSCVKYKWLTGMVLPRYGHLRTPWASGVRFWMASELQREPPHIFIPGTFRVT